MSDIEWKSISEASREFNISHHVVKRLINENSLESKQSLVDKRKILVNMAQLREILGIAHQSDNNQEVKNELGLS